MKRRFTEESWRREPWFQSLISAFRACRTDTQMEDLLRDVATLSELKAVSARLEIARLLGRGLSFRQVSTMTGASTTTVARVAHFLENGEGGYRQILKVHRHHHIRKKRALPEEKKSEIILKEQIFVSDELNEPFQKEKSKRISVPASPLQKYLKRAQV